MNFNITTQTIDGRSRIYIYDNILNRVYNKDLNQINIENIYELGISKPIADRSRFWEKSTNLKTLKIQIGLGCNLNCSYCGQRYYVSEDYRTVNCSNLLEKNEPDIEFFLKRIKSVISSVENIVFVGGEPLLYLQRLFPLVSGLKKLFPCARLTIITNGICFDKNIADWLLENKIRLLLSHDGPNSTKYRVGLDVFCDSNKIDLLRYFIDSSKRNGFINSFQICTVISNINTNLREIVTWFENKLQRSLHINFESIVRLNKNTQKFVQPFTVEDLNYLADEIESIYLLPAGISLRAAVKDVAERILRSIDLHQLGYACDVVQADVLSCDLFGNILTCAPYPARLTSYGAIEHSSFAETSKLIPWHKRKNCSSCPFLVSCLGGCSFQSEENHEISCHTLRYWHAIIFNLAWKMIFKERILNIKGVNEDEISGHLCNTRR